MLKKEKVKALGKTKWHHKEEINGLLKKIKNKKVSDMSCIQFFLYIAKIGMGAIVTKNVIRICKCVDR